MKKILIGFTLACAAILLVAAGSGNVPLFNAFLQNTLNGNTNSITNLANVSAQHFIGDGSQLTGVSGSGGGGSAGIAGTNIFITQTIVGTNTNSTISTTSNIYGNFIGPLTGTASGNLTSASALNPGNISAGTASINISGAAATATTATNLAGSITSTQLPSPANFPGSISTPNGSVNTINGVTTFADGEVHITNSTTFKDYATSTFFSATFFDNTSEWLLPAMDSVTIFGTNDASYQEMLDVEPIDFTHPMWNNEIVVTGQSNRYNVTFFSDGSIAPRAVWSQFTNIGAQTAFSADIGSRRIIAYPTAASNLITLPATLSNANFGVNQPATWVQENSWTRGMSGILIGGSLQAGVPRQATTEYIIQNLASNGTSICYVCTSNHANFLTSPVTTNLAVSNLTEVRLTSCDEQNVMVEYVSLVPTISTAATLNAANLTGTVPQSAVPATAPMTVTSATNLLGTLTTNLALTGTPTNASGTPVVFGATASADTPGDIVIRDGSGNFSAGTITAALTGNASGSAASFTGNLAGNVTGTQGATVVSAVPIGAFPSTWGTAITNLINSFSLACSNLSFALGTTYTNLFVTNNYAPILTLSSNLAVNQGGIIAGKFTNSSLTAGLLVVSDANKALASGPANSAGALMNNGSGTLSWGAVVTSVGIGEDANGIFSSWTGSPISSSGSLTPVFATENANTFFSGPSTGAAASPTFRAIVPADLPLATTSAFGAVKPDGTTVTIAAGVISAVSSGGGASYITNAAAATVALSGTGSTNFLFPCYPTNTQIGTLPTNVFKCTLTANCEFFAPTNLSPTATPPADGQAIRVEFIQDGTGGRILTVATSSASPPYVKFGTDIPYLTLSTAANAVDVATFQYNAAFTNWFCTGFVRGYGQ